MKEAGQRLFSVFKITVQLEIDRTLVTKKRNTGLVVNNRNEKSRAGDGSVVKTLSCLLEAGAVAFLLVIPSACGCGSLYIYQSLLVIPG